MNETKYIDGDREVAKQYRCDIIQLKYDGWFCRCVSDGREQTYFSETDRPFFVTQHTMPSGVFLGEFMRGTQWAKSPERHGRFYVFDLIELNGMPIVGTYAQRIGRLRMVTLPAHWSNVLWHRTAERDAVWKHFVEGLGYEGLVYRWSQGMRDYPIVREKNKFTLDGVILEVLPGEGKHEGRMGAVKVQLQNGAITSVGNGWSDEAREDIWMYRLQYVGRALEIETNAQFASGNLRHGRFVRWREDKDVPPTSPSV